MAEALNDAVRTYWEKEPCGTAPALTGGGEKGSRVWFENVERNRYALEPFIHEVARFGEYAGKSVLEVGVGAGTDHLQWARAGARCSGVDLTDAAIETTRKHLALYGLSSDLRRADAETLPFPDASFDAVYSWGVIHHSEKPEQIIAEIRRVLKPGGVFIGMLYGRRSLVAFKLWVKHALLKFRPWRTLGDVVWHHMESVGTKSYTVPEVKALFSSFGGAFWSRTIMTPYDKTWLPRWMARLAPERWGWFIALRAEKK